MIIFSTTITRPDHVSGGPGGNPPPHTKPYYSGKSTPLAPASNHWPPRKRLPVGGYIYGIAIGHSSHSTAGRRAAHSYTSSSAPQQVLHWTETSLPLTSSPALLFSVQVSTKRSTLQQILYEMACRYASAVTLLVVVVAVVFQATSAAFLVPEGKSSPAHPRRVCEIIY